MEEIAQVYARSLFEVAVEHDALDEIREQLSAFADAMHDNRDLAVFFFSPYFSVVEKKDGLSHTVTDANPALYNFLEALIERTAALRVGDPVDPAAGVDCGFIPAAAGKRGRLRRLVHPVLFSFDYHGFLQW